MEWRSQLRNLRNYHGLKQTVIAELLNVTQATVSRWESGRQVPDLSAKKRIRDLLHRFSTRLEANVRALLSSTIVDRSLLDMSYIIRDVSEPALTKIGVNKSDIIGHSANTLRNDIAYQRLLFEHDRIISRGEFVNMESVFFSQKVNAWISTYTVPVLISGRIHLLSDRAKLDPSASREPALKITLLEEAS